MEDEIIDINFLVEKTYRNEHQKCDYEGYRQGFISALNLLNYWKLTENNEFPIAESWVLADVNSEFIIVSYDPESRLWIDKNFKPIKVNKWKYILTPNNKESEQK